MRWVLLRLRQKSLKGELAWVQESVLSVAAPEPGRGGGPSAQSERGSVPAGLLAFGGQRSVKATADLQCLLDFLPSSRIFTGKESTFLEIQFN